MKRSRESAEGAVAFTVKTYGRMDVLVNGAAGNFLANAHELKLKVRRSVTRGPSVGDEGLVDVVFVCLPGR